MRTRHEAADHEFLALVDPHLRPGARAFSRLVETALALRYDAFKLLAHSGKHLGGGGIELFGNENPRGANLDSCQKLSALDERQAG